MDMKLPNWDRSRWLVFGAMVASVLVLAIFGYYKLYLPQSKFQSHQIQAQLIEWSVDSFNILGVPISDKLPENSDFKNPRQIKIVINSNTKFLRVQWADSTAQSALISNSPLLATHSGNSQTGNIQDLKSQRGILLIVKTVENVGNEGMVTAREINYSLPTGANVYGFAGTLEKAEGVNRVTGGGTFFMQNSQELFNIQKSNSVIMSLSENTPINRIVINKPEIDPVTKQPIGEFAENSQVSVAQFLADVAMYKNLMFRAASSTNIYGLSSFTPTQIYYTITPSSVKR